MENIILKLAACTVTSLEAIYFVLRIYGLSLLLIVQDQDLIFLIKFACSLFPFFFLQKKVPFSFGFNF